MSIKSVAVYCSSSSNLDSLYFDASVSLGGALASTNRTLVYGGSNVGLMKTVASAVKNQNGSVIGVIPDFFCNKGLAFEACDQLIVAKDMRERKQIMEAHSDAFIIMPGGFGTLDEFFEILTLKQLGVHDKPIALFNVNGFFNGLMDFIESKIYAEQFAKADFAKLYKICNSVEEILEYFGSYTPPVLEKKWFG